MSLATRCSTCGTVFRVVQDQLRVSDGWVRCGRCDAVFDATESLFDLDSGQPAQVPGIGEHAGAASAPPTVQTGPRAHPVPPSASGSISGFGPALRPRTQAGAGAARSTGASLAAAQAAPLQAAPGVEADPDLQALVELPMPLAAEQAELAELDRLARQQDPPDPTPPAAAAPAEPAVAAAPAPADRADDRMADQTADQSAGQPADPVAKLPPAAEPQPEPQGPEDHAQPVTAAPQAADAAQRAIAEALAPAPASALIEPPPEAPTPVLDGVAKATSAAQAAPAAALPDELPGHPGRAETPGLMPGEPEVPGVPEVPQATAQPDPEPDPEPKWEPEQEPAREAPPPASPVLPAEPDRLDAFTDLADDPRRASGRLPPGGDILVVDDAPEPVMGSRALASVRREPLVVPSLADDPPLSSPSELPLPHRANAPHEPELRPFTTTEIASDALDPSAPVQPRFVREAARAAFWRRPLVRAALLAGVGVGAAAALAQAAWLWRDHLAAHVPAAEPALRAMCEHTGCQLQPLRRIEFLSVDSSGLNRVEGQQDQYLLQVQLHNRASTAVATPSLDLTLTDPEGRLVARRVLQPAELGLQAALSADQDLPLRVLLSSQAGRPIDGYTLELFYP